jgi:hypothetical protein
MILCMKSYVISCHEPQDCVVVLMPYPNNPNPVESYNVKTDYDLMGTAADCLVLYARPQLFFKISTANCVRQTSRLKASVHSGSHKAVSLVYFSTFEPIDLTPDSIMKQAGVPTLYDSASIAQQPAPAGPCPASTSARWPTCWGAPP